MDAKQQLGIEQMIESFMEAYPSSNISTHNKSLCDCLIELSQLESCVSHTTMDDISNKYYTKHILENVHEILEEQNNFEWPFMYAPYFTHEEVQQLQGYYYETVGSGTQYNPKPWSTKIMNLQVALKNTIDPDEIEDIKKQLSDLGCDPETGDNYDFTTEAALGTQFHPITWHKKLSMLSMELKNTTDPDEINRIKQEMIDTGWNPEIDFTNENMALAKKRIERIYKERYSDTITLDLQPFIEEFNADEAIHETNANSGIYPIHIVLVRGNSPFSKVIGDVTKGEFSHSAICLDNDFDRLYSFNLDNQLNKGVGGFSLESIRNYPKDNRLAIFSFFVNKNDYDKIQDRVQMLLNNIKSTTYSMLNILLFPFQHINLNLSDSMICSQFVDSIMKMVNIDITGKDSSKVSPNFLYSKSVDNKKLYKVFDGIVSKFNAKKAEKYINRMSKKAKPINESKSEVLSLLNAYIYPVITEARKFPIEIKDDGDVLLTNNLIDFDAEYSASHKLLMEYDKAGNIEGMKYELARLYYMNYILEKKLYHNKYLKNKEKNIKTRARVLNDFNKYMKVVLKAEPDFNFGAYYEQSPFYAHTVEIKGSTVSKLKDIISYIL